MTTIASQSVQPGNIYCTTTVSPFKGGGTGVDVSGGGEAGVWLSGLDAGSIAGTGVSGLATGGGSGVEAGGGGSGSITGGTGEGGGISVGCVASPY